MPYALIVGPLFGLVAVLFMLAIRMSARFAAKSSLSPAQLILMAGLLTGDRIPARCAWEGTEQVAAMIEGRYQIGFLALLLLLRSSAQRCAWLGLFERLLAGDFCRCGVRSGYWSDHRRSWCRWGRTGDCDCGMASVAASVMARRSRVFLSFWK